MSLTIEPSNIYLYVGDTWQYTAHFEDGTVLTDVIWSVTNSNVITIDENGLLRALYPGYEHVHAVTLDGNHQASSNVIVYSGNSDTGGKLRCVSLDDITFVHGVGGHGQVG